MKPLNDDQLSLLLRQAKANQPQPGPGFVPRVMQAYQKQSGRSPLWSRVVFGTVRMPIPVGVVAVVVLILAGMMLGQRLSEAPSAPTPAVQGTFIHAGSRDGLVLSVDGFRPVAELRPRIVSRSKHETR